MYKVKKRTGDIEIFELSKVISAIKKAFESCNRDYQDSIVEMVAIKSIAGAEKKITDSVLCVEDIQNSIESVLMGCGYDDVAKSYILYRKHSEDVKKNTTLDFKKLVESYIKEDDWRVKENATVTYSLGGLILGNSGAVTANYWLSEIYDKEAADAHRNCDIHIHDLSMLAPYCAGWSLKELIKSGISGVSGKISSKPAKHLSTLCNQIVNFLGCLQNEWCGAQAFSSVDTLLAPFVKYENLSYVEVKQCIQSLIFGLNTPSRWGCQAPFSNFTFDWTVPNDLAEMNCLVGGKELDFKYKDCKREMDMINRAFIETMIDGDANGRGFQYPIPTYSITKDFDWDEESINNKLLFEMTAKYGIPYFSNYINSDLDPSSIRSMCCRLRLNLRELRRKNGGFFGSGDNTGSVQVCTINLPRLAYKSDTEKDFYKNLEHIMDICSRVLEKKREVVTHLYKQGLYPYTKRYLDGFENHFSTIATVGMNEMCLNAKWINDNIASEKGYKFAQDVLDFIRNKLSDYQEQFGNLFNLESAPAESTCLRFALHDKKDFPDIITAGDRTDGAPYYTNSSNLPVNYTDDIFEALDHQDKLQTKYTGGTVFHAFLGEKLPSWKSAMQLTKKIAENYKLPYFTFSPTYSICQDHGYIAGEHWTCPHCGKETEVYSRVTGYYRAVQNFNDGKAHEFRDRKEYVITSNQLCETDAESHTAEEVQMNKLTKNIGKTYTRPILITTETCPNCKIVKQFIADSGFDCEIILASDNIKLVQDLGVEQAPTLVVFDESNNAKLIANASNIRAYIESLNN